MRIALLNKKAPCTNNFKLSLDMLTNVTFNIYK